MDEDECDYRSPIGRIIKQINASCKKTQIDNQLSEVILFSYVFNLKIIAILYRHWNHLMIV